jgi:CHAP domain-containing protein
MRAIIKLAAWAVVAAGLAGCASDPVEYSEMPRERGHSMVEAGPAKPLQCVPYAREHSGIKIHGDANTWWDRAAGKYPRGSAPETGSVMVLHDYAGTSSGHVAVVKTLVSSREIRVDHANWLNDGSIYVNDPVMDVSQDNDWSAVRVYNIKTGGWGAKVYPVQGFIGSHNNGPSGLDQDDHAPAQPDLVAQEGGGMGRVALAADESP